MVKDLEGLWAGPYKGRYSADDVMPRHYGACGICREFDDAVLQHGPGNRRHETTAACVEGNEPRHLRAVTRAGGPSNQGRVH